MEEGCELEDEGSGSCSCFRSVSARSGVGVLEAAAIRGGRDFRARSRGGTSG